MKLEGLKDFDWYNEPENVIFGIDELKVIAKPNTDFWQSKHHNFAKDNGHLFFCEKEGDFSCTIQWAFEKAQNFNQAGLMLRFDAQNWFKVAIMSESEEKPEIASSLTKNGFSDWAGVALMESPDSLWFKLLKRGNDYVVFYSLDGTDFIRIRQFYLSPESLKTKVGAYVCSPQKDNFTATLKEINIAPSVASL